jgi:NADH-quinone oxidoreductase subunit L
LWILAVGAVLLGGLLDHHTTGIFNSFLERTIPADHAAAQHGGVVFVMAVSTVAAALGFGVAYLMYASGTSPLPARINALAGPLADLSRRKFYFDEIYDALFVWPLKALADLSRFLDWALIDGLLVGGIGKLPALLGRLPRPIQNGLVQFYALAMMLALSVLLWVLLTKQG